MEGEAAYKHDLLQYFPKVRDFFHYSYRPLVNRDMSQTLSSGAWRRESSGIGKYLSEMACKSDCLLTPEETCKYSTETLHSFLADELGNPAYCAKCSKECSGEVLRVENRHFHAHCFVCRGKVTVFEI